MKEEKNYYYWYVYNREHALCEDNRVTSNNSRNKWLLTGMGKLSVETRSKNI